MDGHPIVGHLIRLGEDAQGSLDQLLLCFLGKSRWTRDHHDWHGSSPSFGFRLRGRNISSARESRSERANRTHRLQVDLAVLTHALGHPFPNEAARIGGSVRPRESPGRHRSASFRRARCRVAHRCRRQALTSPPIEAVESPPLTGAWRAPKICSRTYFRLVLEVPPCRTQPTIKSAPAAESL